MPDKLGVLAAILAGAVVAPSLFVWVMVRIMQSESREGVSSGGGLGASMGAIDRIVRPSIEHVERVHEEAVAEEDQDGD